MSDHQEDPEVKNFSIRRPTSPAMAHGKESVSYEGFF